jgi:hypothetical protein
MLREVLLEAFYWPPVSWIAWACRADILWLEACEHYQKGSYRNRCYIAGPNGIQRLSIPLQKGKNRQMPIREVRIASDTSWQRLHWRSIRTAYGRAPFFEHYADEVFRFFEKPYTFLFDLNVEIAHFLGQKMKWTAAIRPTEGYLPREACTEQSPLLDLRGKIAPGQVPALPLQPYPQVFEDRFGFLADLCALDLLFCQGPYASDCLYRRG